MDTSLLFTQILWAIIGLPIIYYPMILLANVMSFAAPRVQKITLKGTLFRIFMVVTTLYPLIYYFCYKASVTCVEEGMLLDALLYAIPPLAIGGTLYWILKK
ncbi:MAG: hypothetical protein K0R51_329 [Cytophagaceae bacterium]|nr:hypothetical protein [Cytophagaceae bacterium]